MKSGQLFWGFFLLTLGALFLLTKYDILYTSFDFVYNIWPFIFVFWGALVIFKNSLVRPVISAVFGVFLAMLLFGFIYNSVCGIDFTDHDEVRGLVDAILVGYLLERCLPWLSFHQCKYCLPLVSSKD